MTDTTDYTIAAQTEQGAVIIAEVTHTDLTGPGTIEHIDPNTLEVETNVRTIVNVDAALVASIREFGVLEPVVCRRTEDGTVQVRMGQRRVLAARKAERPTIPAYIVEGDDTTVTRLVEQFAENEHRAGLSEPERAAVFQQLAFEGLNVAQIAKQTGVKKAVVEAGITVAESEFAGKIATKHAVTLDQAAALIEFEDDKDAVGRLVQTAEDSPEQFAHELQRQRDTRARNEQVAAERNRLEEAGFTILESRPESYFDKEHISIRELVTAEGERVTVEDLAEVEQKFAHVRAYYGGEVDVAYFVIDPKALGFKKVSSNGSVSGGMSDEQKAERKTLIANNKAWDSAEVVRREWLTTFLSRKTLPKEAAAFVAHSLTAHRNTIAAAIGNGNRLAASLLSLDAPESYWAASPLDSLATTQPAKAGHVTLAVVIGGYEASTGRHTWRSPGRDAFSYFTQIAAWGYPLSEVEQIVAAATPAERPAPEADDEFEGDFEE
jgi:ParB family chromosome partitioning protein